ncbi:MAG: hypothetical protein BWY74_00147 [Firmicutes bacterium ADurb.Bin419]|nr:MAG: hypothetical protein BWY74_00147 [Firmicutes bacterium ADurb.Bin419]
MAWYDYLNPFSQVAQQSGLQNLSKLRIGLSQPGGYLPKVLTPYKDYVPGLNVTPFGWREASAKTLPEENASGQMTPWSPGYDPSADPSSGYGGWGESGSGGFQPTFFGGRWYSDPESLSQAIIQYAEGEAGREARMAEEEYSDTIGDIKAEQSRVERELPQAREKGMKNIGSYFAALSPDVLQSEEGVRKGEFAGEVDQQQKDAIASLQRSIKAANRELRKVKSGIDRWLSGQRESAAQVYADTWSGGIMPDVAAPTVSWNAPEYKLDVPAMIAKLQQSPTLKGTANRIASQSTASQPKVRTQQEEDAENPIKQFVYSGV